LDGDLELPEGHGVLVHVRECNACIIMPMRGKVHLVKNHYKLLEGHIIKVLAVKFNPINETYIFNAVKCMFDNFIAWNIFVVGILFTGSFPVNTCLGCGIACTHIGWFGVQFMFDNGNGGRIKLGGNSRHDVKLNIMRGGNN
jgi:hypothetical protein